MKIGYLTNVYPAVSHSFIKREILALERLGAKVVRWSIRPFSSDLPDPGDQQEASRTTVVLQRHVRLILSAIRSFARSPSRWFGALAASLEGRPAGIRPAIARFGHFVEACYVACLARDLELDHLHAHFGTNSASVVRLAHRMGGPAYSFTVHGPDEFDQPVALSLGKKVQEARFAIAISNFGRSQLMRWTDPDCWNKVHVVRCGLDETFLAEPPVSPSDFGAAQLCCVARLAPQKGLPILVDAAELLSRSGAAFKIVIVGDGPLRAWLESTIRKRRLEPYFDLRGWAGASEVREVICRSRAFVLPSFAEGLPVSIMEALALERPVITTRIAGIGELVDEACGWLVDAGEAEQLAQAMRMALVADPSQLRRMGVVGRSRVLSEHDADINAAKLFDLVRKESGVSDLC